MRKYLTVFLFIFLSVIITSYAAAATKTQKAEPIYVANFDYAPDSQAAPDSAGVTFAIGSVSYLPDNMSGLWIRQLVALKEVSGDNSSGKILWFSFPQFSNLYKAIKKDLSKLLTIRGFSVRGPFDSYDLIPYPDKKAIDLLLVAKPELSVMLKDEEVSTNCTGNVEVNGKINLELREIVTQELMWAKSIPFAEFGFHYSISFPSSVKREYTLMIDDVPYPGEGGAPFNVYKKYILIMNDVAKGLEKQYPELMAAISNLIDPEEMRIIKKQCQELKSKKGY